MFLFVIPLFIIFTRFRKYSSQRYVLIACIYAQVLTDSCATSKLMQYNDSTQRFVINKDNAALISDVKIILEMLLSWRAWERSADGVFLMALQALNSLVRTEHPHRQYNIEQYRRAGVIGKLLDICKVSISFLYSANCLKYMLNGISAVV